MLQYPRVHRPHIECLDEVNMEESDMEYCAGIKKASFADEQEFGKYNVGLSFEVAKWYM